MKKFLIGIYVRVVTWFKEGQNEGNGYLIPLHSLIDRAEYRYLIETGFESPICPQCFIHRGVKSKMDFRHSHIFSGVPLRDDQGWKCTYCYHTFHVGIPINSEDAKEEIHLRGGSSYLMRPSFRPDERGDEEVKERLRKLGYIE